MAVTADRFVGRTRELQRLAAAFAAARDGRGSVTVVTGEQGIGKSRLCEAAAALADDLGLTVVASRCWVDGGAPPLWPWQPILRALCGEGAADLLAADTGAETDRFARFAAVTDRLTAAAERSPTVLIIDDVQAADAGTLLLLRFLTRSLPGRRMAVVLSRRAVAPAPLLADIEAEATPIVLGGLDEAEAAALLGLAGLDAVAPDLLRTVVRVSGGNPLYLRRIAALGAPLRGGGVPEGLQLVIERSLQELPAAAQWVLRTSAVLGPAVSVPEAAVVAGVDAADVLDAAAEAATLGLVTVEGTDRVSFGHELVRAACEAGLGSADRLDAHARAVAGLGVALTPDRLARRAYHALAAAPRSVADARLAVAAGRDAARAMEASFAYEQADTLLSAVVELHDGGGLGPASGGLLVEWAQAALSSGRLAEARVRFDRAATAAEHEDDPVSFAEAALGLGGHWINEHRAPLERVRVHGLQRSAWDRLATSARGADGIDPEPLRVRLAARRAAEGVYQGEPAEPVFAALDRARRCGDPAALAEALSLSHHALLAPEHAGVRLELADELIQVASAAGHGVLGLMGLCWRAVDLFLAGDDRAVRALEDLRARADALACQNILYIVEALDVMLLVRRGRLADATVAAGRCYELGVEVGEQDALGYLAAHTLVVHWVQGRDVELLDAADSFAASSTLIEGEFSLRASAAAIAARSGQHDRARAALDLLTRDGLATLPRSSVWLTGVATIVEAAAELGDEAIAREAYDLLLPFADRPVMPSLAVVCLGSTERFLGVAALAMGKADLAVAHLEAAVEANRRLGNGPLVAMCQAELAHVLVSQAAPDAALRAVALLDTAAAAADGMEMPLQAAAWRTARDAVAPGMPRSGRVRREGRGWVVAVDDHQVFVGDLVGMAYLAQLLRHPGREIPALTLAGAGPLPPEGRQEVLDGVAKAAYAAKARELSEELAEAEAAAELGRAERLRDELDTLVDHVETALGLHGRSRTFTGRAERARTAVRKALTRAMADITAADPVLGRQISSSITTGVSCCYSPSGSSAAIVWSVDDAG